MIPTEKVRGVGPALRLALAKCGFRTAEDLANADLVDLLNVPGIGSASAPRLIAAAKTAIVEEKKAPPEKPETRPVTLSPPHSPAEEARVDSGAADSSGTAKTETKTQKEKKKKKAKAARQAAKLQAKLAKDAAKRKAKAAKKARKLEAKAAKKAAKLNATLKGHAKAAGKTDRKSKRKKANGRKKGSG